MDKVSANDLKDVSKTLISAGYVALVVNTFASNTALYSAALFVFFSSLIGYGIARWHLKEDTDQQNGKEDT